MEPLWVDLHLHTNRESIHLERLFSCKPTASPRVMARAAKRAGMDAIAITDHDLFLGEREAKRLSRTVGITVIPGAEVGIAWFTHVLVLGFSPEKKVFDKRAFSCLDDFVDWVHDNNGLCIMAHPKSSPMRYLRPWRMRVFDGIEVINGMGSVIRPEPWMRLTTAGSDSHSPDGLGYCYNVVNAENSVDDILEALARGECKPVGSPWPRWMRIAYVKRTAMTVESRAYNRVKNFILRRKR